MLGFPNREDQLTGDRDRDGAFGLGDVVFDYLKDA
jgi:hypothetical protein